MQYSLCTGRGPQVTVVVDATVMVAALVDSGPEGRWAETVVGENALAAPEVVLVEATNILRHLEHRREITRMEANGAMRDLLRRDIELLPFAPFAERAWELRHRVSIQDAWYVAVAEAFGLPLATLDGRLRRAAGVRCRCVGAEAGRGSANRLAAGSENRMAGGRRSNRGHEREPTVWATPSAGGMLEEAILTEIVRRIVEIARPERIILYGSAARGEMGPQSNVDLLVVKEGGHRRDTAALILDEMSGVGAAVDVVVVTPEDIERYGDNHALVIKPALQEGKVVYRA